MYNVYYIICIYLPQKKYLLYIYISWEWMILYIYIYQYISHSYSIWSQWEVSCSHSKPLCQSKPSKTRYYSEAQNKPNTEIHSTWSIAIPSSWMIVLPHIYWVDLLYIPNSNRYISTHIPIKTHTFIRFKTGVSPLKPSFSLDIPIKTNQPYVFPTLYHSISPFRTILSY